MKTLVWASFIVGGLLIFGGLLWLWSKGMDWRVKSSPYVLEDVRWLKRG